jgi:hypothetical protein
MKRLSHEVANASTALENELPVRTIKPGHADVLVQTARRLERLQARGRKLRRELKQIDADIRFEKRTLRALIHSVGSDK